jgi:Tfp pilus assembly protein PilO
MARFADVHVWSRNSLRHWGWPGATGLVLLLLAAVLASAWLPNLAERSRNLTVAASAAAEAEQQARRDRQRSLTTATALTPAQRFASAFPDPELREARVADLLASARSSGLSLQRGEFRLTREPQIGLLKYSLNLPLSGSYAQLRAFVEDTQNRDTAIALERMRLQRSSARAMVVDADLTWSFYMRASPSEIEAAEPTKPLKPAAVKSAVKAPPKASAAR